MNVLELLGHPVRLRIVHALRGGQTMTTTDLGDRIPDVSKATVYRHVDLLSEGGILEVAEERRVRGAVERTYRLRPERAVIDAATAASLTPEDHRYGFSVAMAALISEFNAYLDRDQADPSADPVGYRQHAVWLSPDELTTLIGELRKAIVPVLSHLPSSERSQYLLSPILFPIAEPGR